MRLILNVLWFVFGGGLLLGIAHLKLVPVAFWPLGREIVTVT